MKITLDLTWSIIDFEDTPQLFSTVDKELRYKMGFREDGYMFSPAFKGGHWDGYTTLHENYKLENKPFIKYPTGLTDEVDAILGELQTRINFEYTIFDNRPDPLLTPEDVPEQFHLKSAESGDITLRDYQMDGVRAIAKSQVGVLHLATNAGKSLTAAAIIKLCYDKLERGERIAFFTHSSAIFNQVHKELTEALGIRVGKYGNGKKVIDTVSVVMIPTVQAALKIDPEKGLKLSAKERIIKRIAKDLTPQFDKGINQRLLLKNYIQNFQPKTNTDKDYINEVEEVLYTCGTDAQVKFKLNSYVVAYNKIIEKKNKDLYTKRKDATEYLESLVAIISDEHHHVKSDSYYNVLMSCTNAIVRVGLTGSIDEKDKMLMKRMKGSTHGVVARVSNDYLIGEGFSAKPKIILTPVKQVLLNGHQADISGEKDYRVVYDNGIVHNQYRNTLIAKITEMCYQDGDGVLIIVNRIDHGNNIGEILAQLNVPFEFVTGDHDVDSREDSFQAMKDGHLKVLISTSLIDEGVSISGINSLIMAAGGKSMRQVLQRTGRVLRKKKGDNTAKLYDFRDQTNTYMLDHAAARESIYIEEGFEIIRL